jgi:hypothetical protein
MPKERYTDRELEMLAKAAEALETVMDGCGYRDLLYGKWSLLTGDIRHEHALRDEERAAMFVSPQRQLFNLARWNARRGWGFTDDDLSDISREIPPEPPAPEKGRLQLTARVLEVYLSDGSEGMPGILRTFREFTSILADEQGMKPFHLFDLWPQMQVALSPGLRHVPGLRWRTIDFGHGWGVAEPDCRKLCGFTPFQLPPSLERPHAGLLAAAAHFPLWLKRMDGKSVPRIWLPGYEFVGVPHNLGPSRDRIVHHPRLTQCHDGQGFLYYGWDRVPCEDMAVPVYADTKTDP